MSNLSGNIESLDLKLMVHDNRLGIDYPADFFVSRVSFGGTYTAHDRWFSRELGWGEDSYVDEDLGLIEWDETAQDLEHDCRAEGDCFTILDELGEKIEEAIHKHLDGRIEDFID